MKLTEHEVRKVSVLATCDPRTVRRHLAGQTVRQMVRERIVAAINQLGLGQEGSPDGR